AARLVNARGGLGVFHDLGDRVAHVEDKAGGKLPIGTAGIHQRRRVWEEQSLTQYVAQVAHKAFTFVVVTLGRGHVVDYSLDDRVPVFCDLTARVFTSVTLCGDFVSIVSQRGFTSCDHNGLTE